MTDWQPRTPRPAHRRAILRVTADQIAGLLRLPDDVTVAAFALDPLRDSIAFALESDRFEPVAPGADPPDLASEREVDIDEDGTVTLRVAWPDLGGAGYSIRHASAASATTPLPARIVEVILADLIGRKGFDWAWDDIDNSIQVEIRQTLEGKVREVLDGNQGAT